MSLAGLESLSPWKNGRAKPVIGVVGGIGSGKSTIARLFESQGCAVIDSDALAHEALQSAEIKAELRHWLGEGVFFADGQVSRKAVGSLVFRDPDKISRLNELIHPQVAAMRERQMGVLMKDPAVRAVIWDSPLLVEAGLYRDCDAVVFVDVPDSLRQERVARTRGWSAEELGRREKSQFPLDKKAQVADYCIDNSGDEAHSLRQIQRVLSQLFAKTAS